MPVANKVAGIVTAFQRQCRLHCFRDCTTCNASAFIILQFATMWGLMSNVRQKDNLP